MQATDIELSAIRQSHRQLRANIRAFLMVATMPQLLREYEISLGHNDFIRARFVQELIDEQLSESPTIQPTSDMGS